MFSSLLPRCSRFCMDSARLQRFQPFFTLGVATETNRAETGAYDPEHGHGAGGLGRTEGPHGRGSALRGRFLCLDPAGTAALGPGAAGTPRGSPQSGFPVGLVWTGACSRVRNVWFPPALGTAHT